MTTQDRWSALAVDRSDPFFFDHPLDHVSGMLLLSGLLDAVAAERAPAWDDRVLIALRFMRRCSLDRPTALRVRASQPPGSWLVSAVQDGRAVCEGSVTVGGGAGAASATSGAALSVAAGPSRRVVPVDGRLVHRHRPQNIAIGAPTALAGGDGLSAAVLEPPPGHRLADPDDPVRAIERLIEAARQFASYLLLKDSEEPGAARLLWLSLTAELTRAPALGAPLELLCSPMPGTARITPRMLAVDPHTGAQTASLHLKLFRPREAVATARDPRLEAAVR